MNQDLEKMMQEAPALTLEPFGRGFVGAGKSRSKKAG